MIDAAGSAPPRVPAALAAAALVLVSSRHAAADSPVVEAAPIVVEMAAAAREDAPEPPRPEWYGWQTLLEDGAAGLFLAGGIGANIATTDSKGAAVLYVLGCGGYLLAPPTTHLLHGNFGRGFGSLGLRIGGPILVAIGVAVAAATSRDHSATIGAGGMVVAAGAAVAPTVIDASLLAYEAPAPTAPARAAGIRVAPAIAPARNGATAGIGGTF